MKYAKEIFENKFMKPLERPPSPSSGHKNIERRIEDMRGSILAENYTCCESLPSQSRGTGGACGQPQF